MKNSNNSLGFLSTTFILVGIPGLESEHLWISIPFCLIYIIIFLGNGIVLHVIRTDFALHQPMYLFLAMLALAEVGVSASTLPTVLGIFLFRNTEISFEACLPDVLHPFFLHYGVSCAAGHVFGSLYSHLQPTALYSYADTAQGLWHRSYYHTEKHYAHGSIAHSLTASALLWPQCPLTFLLSAPQSYLSCGNISVNNIYGIFIVISTFGLDSLLIVISYGLILHTVLGIATGEGQKKALNTCGSHVCAVLAYYVPMIGLSIVHRLGHRVSPLLRAMMANAYLFFPPVVNPIVYSIKTKEIHGAICRMLSEKRPRL
ncbi:LOW QUALITY PROTEIN: OR51J1 isoform 1 [Pongo abelii]|uniref:OR51J1 isoform 1 n=1 Tax=Pongo abelii TaxID=9601 RepID=A0A2J8SVX2_PONAB|nr:LOW QUALITY PROTEIN: OR51J1 isoform 1 [Pongo abelii]